VGLPLSYYSIMNIKTIKELNQRIWYRLLKVIYIFSLIFVIGVGLVFIKEEVLDRYIVLGLGLCILSPISIFIGFEIIRRLFFYVILGTMKPIDDNYLIRFKRYEKLITIILIILIIVLIYGIWRAYQLDMAHQIDRNRLEIERVTPSAGLPPLPKLPGFPPLPPLPKLPAF